MIKAVLNAVIYTRVSTEDQVANFSLEGQEKYCRQYAESHDLNVLKIFREEGASAKTVNGRPTLLELVKFCNDKKNLVSKIIVYKYDRWSRNTSEGLGLMGVLAKQGIDVSSATEPSENNAMGKAIRGMMLVWAELDNNIRSERTISGMKTALENGHWPWKAPIGYKHVIMNEKKKLVFIEGYRPILENLFLEAGTGIYTKPELAIKMNKRGFQALFSKPATQKTVEKILSKKFYFGIMQAKNWALEFKGNHETVADSDTWTRAFNATFKRSVSKLSTDEEYPLRRFVTCESCYKPLTGSYSKGNGGRYSYYHCNNSVCASPVRVSREVLNEAFGRYLDQFTLSERQQQLLRAVLMENAEKEVLRNDQGIKQLEVHLGNIEEEKRGIIKANNKGILSDGETEKIIGDLRVQEAVYKVEISEKTIDRHESQAVIDFTTNFLVNVGRLWQRLDLPRKRALQMAVFPEKVFYKDGEFRTNKIADSFNLIGSFANSKDPLVGPLSGGWNSIFTSLFETSQKLIELGFSYYNGKVAIIERQEEPEI